MTLPTALGEATAEGQPVGTLSPFVGLGVTGRLALGFLPQIGRSVDATIDPMTRGKRPMSRSLKFDPNDSKSDPDKWRVFVAARLDGQGVREAARTADYSEGVPSSLARDYADRAIAFDEAKGVIPSERRLRSKLSDLESEMNDLRDRAKDIRRDIRALRAVADYNTEENNR